MKAQQSIDEGGFSRPVGAEQPYRTASERGVQLFQDDALAKAHFQAVQLNDRIHYL